MLNSLVMVLVAVAAVAWLAYMIATSVRGVKRQKVAPNLQPGMPNEELETKRLDNALIWSVIFAAFLAIAMPVFFLGEFDRQAGFAEEFAEESLARGEALQATTEEGGNNCAGCHGPNLSGGVALAVEPRSGVTVQWAAPRLDTVLYRYSRDEVKFWIVYGRPGTPMPPWGLAAGGALNDQEVDDILNYIETIQLPQAEALNLIEGDLAAANARQAGAEEAVATMVETQETLVAFVEDAPELVQTLTPLRQEIQAWAADDGVDLDGDGISDEAELNLPGLFAEIAATGIDRYAVQGVVAVSLPEPELDPRNPLTNGLAPDAEVLADAVSRVVTTVQSFEIAAENQERSLAAVTEGAAFLEDAAANGYWVIDVQAVADATFDGNTERAQRAIDLFTATCARCHTTGFSAGAAFQQPIGSGGIGPSLLPPRALVQFGSAEAVVDFLINGSELGKPYGVNGVGRGYMPGFGALLPREDLALLADYLLGPTLGGPELGGDR